MDDRVMEVCWDTARSGWRYMRFRDDKPNANHKSIMRKIIDSISDGVELEAVRWLIASTRANNNHSSLPERHGSERHGKHEQAPRRRPRCPFKPTARSRILLPRLRAADQV